MKRWSVDGSLQNLDGGGEVVGEVSVLGKWVDGGPIYVDGGRTCPGAQPRVVLNTFGSRCLLGHPEQLLMRKLDI